MQEVIEGIVSCLKPKPTGKELRDFSLMLVAAMRGHSAGALEITQFMGWTKKELEGTADIILEDLREGRTQELESLYMETCGQPFKEVRLE